MAEKLSAYLSIYNDWQLLGPVLESAARFVDELVVVDGAYLWMDSYVRGIGADPTRSEAAVTDILSTFPKPVRVLNGLWRDESEKRMAGYAACSHRYALRFDADEILTLDEAALERFLRSGGSVGEMEVPTYVAPGWFIGGEADGAAPRAGLLFDREQIPAEIHLNYLWLVGADLPAAGLRPALRYAEPVAHVAHMTLWRRPRTSVNRAAFYILNHVREHGGSWSGRPEARGAAALEALFAALPPAAFREALLNSKLVAGYWDLEPGQRLRPNPHEPASATLDAAFRDFLDGLAEMNESLAIGERRCLCGEILCLDMTTPRARAALAPNGRFAFETSQPIAAARAHRFRYLARAPWQSRDALGCRFSGRRLEVDVGDDVDPDALRDVLEIQIWDAEGSRAQSFRVAS